MLSTYPLKPVITTNPVLASAYNEHPESVMLTSRCLTPSGARELLNAGASFEAVVVIGDDGADLMSQFATGSSAPRLTQMNVSENLGEAVRQIHATLQDPPFHPQFLGMGDG